MSLQIVESIRSKYPTPLGGHHAAFLLEVAAALGKGLLKKSGGSRITLPDGTTVSQDSVMLPDGRHWDILSDGEGKASPRYDLLTNPDGTPFLTDPANYYPVQPTVVQENPVVTPPPTSVPVQDYTKEFSDLKDILREIVPILSTIDSRLSALETKNTDLTEIKEKLYNLDLVARNTFYKSKLFGVNFTLNPDVRV